MRRGGRIGLKTSTAAIALALVAAAGAYAAPANSAGAGGVTRVVDRTYLCGVRAERYVDVNASVALPPDSSGHPILAQLWLDTVHKTAPVGGLMAVVPQVEFEGRKNSLQVDNALCHPTSRRVPLGHAGLPLYETATPHVFGHVDERCVTSRRVVVRFRIEMKNGAPQRALFAVRDGNARSRPAEFINWHPRKITTYVGKRCTDMG